MARPRDTSGTDDTPAEAPASGAGLEDAGAHDADHPYRQAFEQGFFGDADTTDLTVAGQAEKSK